MRSMLMSPGSLSGYTFYRVRPESQETDYYDIDEEEEIRTVTKAGSVKVASITADGQIKETMYGQLDRQAQTEVLTDLLVKGAVHYAMKTQQEYVDRMADIDEASEVKVVPKFDMREAVESMLQDSEQKGVPQQLLDTALPERDDRSQHSGSFKGGKLVTHRSSKDDDEDEGWAGRGMVEKHVDQKGQTSDEKRRLDMEKRKARVSAQSLDIEGPHGGHVQSGSESAGPGSTHSSGWLPPVHKQPQWKGSQQSLRSHGSRRPSGSIADGEQGSTKGSVIFGPDGSVIKVGESVKLSARTSQASVHDVVQPGMIDASDDSDAEVPDEWKDRRRPNSGQMSESIRKLPKRESPRTNVTEQEIIDKLTSHASHIAESVLSQSESGQVLEEDIRRAAAMWMDTHPPRDISRSQSVQDLPDTTVIQEVMKGHKRKSAGPTVAEYRDKIKGNLMTALAKATGLNQDEIPQDAEIDPELMEQLANNTLSPEDIEIVRDEESGRSFIRSRHRMISEAMGGVEKGHIYQPAAKNGDKRVSIPTDKKPADIGELDIINFQGQEEAKQSDKGSEVGSKKGSIRSGADAKSRKSGSMKDEDVQKVLDDLSQKGSSPTGGTSVKSGKSGDKSKAGSERKASTPEKDKKKEEFVVASGVDHTKENTKIYGMPPNQPATTTGQRKPKAKKDSKAPVTKKKGDKGKKPKGKGKKKDEVEEPQPAVETKEDEKPPTPVKEKTPPPESPPLERSVTKTDVSDEEEEYIIVRDETMSPEIEIPDKNLNITTSAEEEEPDEEQVPAEDLEDMSEADKLRMISNREARAAKRAAAAEKRRQEVERKRKEREEQIKREKEEVERQEKLKQEQEELRKQKEEERRLKKQREEEENEEQMREELEKQKREKAEADREKRRKEEYARKLEEMKRKQLEDEKRRQEEAERKRLEEEERRKEEEELMAKMAEEERREYERKKREEEEERKRKEEEEKKRREEEAQRALEEARRLAEEMARKQAELEARLRFNRSLQMEANGLEHTQDITKAFVFSYFELLQWLGLDIPEFELLKLNQY
ncbi:hypothetical protein ACF0H5_023336 [Mactra antiquata]